MFVFGFGVMCLMFFNGGGVCVDGEFVGEGGDGFGGSVEDDLFGVVISDLIDYFKDYICDN